MANPQKPRQVIFEIMKHTWGIGHQDFFPIVASDYLANHYRGDAANRGRSIVNAEVEKYESTDFKPFAQSAAVLVSAMHASRKGPHSNEEIVGYLAGEACDCMCESLDRYGLGGAMYANAMRDIAQDGHLSEADRAHLAVLLFCAAGCTGDVRLAVDEALEANRIMGARFTTADADPSRDGYGRSSRMALIRIDAGGHGGQYMVDDGEAGSVIGRQATSEHDISDVDGSVSKQHARIWRDDDGNWWVQGLGSLNGTRLIDGETHEEIVVEPPKSERGDKKCNPFELHAGDTLIFADSTQFLVQVI